MQKRILLVALTFFAIITKTLQQYSMEVASLPPTPSPDGCAICLEDFYNENESLSATHCGHVFHTNCFQRYNETRLHDPLKCPVCKQPVERLTRLYCTLAVPLTNASSESTTCSTESDTDSSANSREKATTRPRRKRKREEKGKDNVKKSKAKHFKKLYRQSQGEIWQWQGKYRQAVESHTAALAAERQQTAQAASLILLLQLQLQQALATHQRQLEQALILALQREEALRGAQLQLQESQPNDSPTEEPAQNIAVLSPLVTPIASANTTAILSPSSPTTTSLVSLLPLLTTSTSSSSSRSSTSSVVLPGAVAALVQYHQEWDTIVQQLPTLGTTTALPSVQHRQQQHDEYLMIIQELASAVAAAGTSPTASTTTGTPTLPSL